jgi:hypothetical protein
LEPLGDELNLETSLEFTLPPGELDRIFIDGSSSVPQALRVEDHRAAPPPEEIPAPPSGALVVASHAHAELPQINPRRRRLPVAVWAAAAALLAVALIAQWVIANGEWLSSHLPPLIGGVDPHKELAAYQLRAGVSGEPAAKGVLRVRASITNTAPRAEVYPLLRVTLANRFGVRVAQREFEPSDYLGKAAAARRLAPGERAEATLDIVDPGKDAEGFEIDVCIRRTGGNLLCTGDAAPPVT